MAKALTPEERQELTAMASEAKSSLERICYLLSYMSGNKEYDGVAYENIQLHSAKARNACDAVYSAVRPLALAHKRSMCRHEAYDQQMLPNGRLLCKACGKRRTMKADVQRPDEPENI